MSQCTACGHENREAARFCLGCGQPLAVQCSACGAELPAGARFCDGCGASLAPSHKPKAESQTASAHLTTNNPTTNNLPPRAYTPQHLADKILQSKSALEGERKQVTVLFADVQGSMELAEQMDPEEWSQIMQRFFRILSDGVERFEGFVDKFTGDGIMALFGAPIAHEDHAQRACYAALRLREELRRYAEELKRTRGLRFAVRMGLNSGEVIVGKIGDDLRMDYTAQGHTVGLAQRMEQLADPGAVYLAERAASHVEGYFSLRDLGPFTIKGVSDAQHVYELQDVGPMRTRLERSRARGFSRFVGREEESQILDMALEKTRQGNGQVVGIVGEAGVGKSRLCYEFVQRCRAGGTPVYEAHCVAHGALIPFLPVLELLRSYFGITEHDSPRDARRKIAGTIVLLDPQLEQTLPLVFDFLGVPDPERPAPPLDPDARQRRLASLLKRMREARSARETAVFFVDDLHWVDSASEAYLATFAVGVGSARALLLVNFRPEYHGDWLRMSSYQQIPLRPLEAAATETLIAELLGSDPSVATLAERVAQRSAGNPFYVEELIVALAEGGSLEGALGRYRLVGSAADVSIPASVQSIIAARIDRLDEREKTVLQTAAVIGNTFSEEILREVVESPVQDLTGTLARLTSAGFVYERELYPLAEYAFKHPLSQEVAYGSQLNEQRVHTHGRVARLVSDLYADRHDDKAAMVAHHWEQAGDQLQAAQWLSRAAEWAGGNQIEEAMRYWSKVRELLRSVPRSPESMFLGAEACANILLDGSRMGIPEEELAATFLEGVELARSSGDKRALCEFLSTYLFRTVFAFTTPEEFRPVLEETERLTEEIEDIGTRMWALGARSMVALFWENVNRSLELAERGCKLLSSYRAKEFRGITTPDVMVLAARGRALNLGGHPREAVAALREALMRAEGRENPALLCAIHAGISLPLGFTGDDLDAGLQHALKAVENAERVGSWSARVIGYDALGNIQLIREEWEAALRTQEHVLSMLREHRTVPMIERSALADIARARLETGAAQAAEEAARRAVAIPDSSDGGFLRPLACLALIHVLLRTKGIEAAAEIESLLEESRASIARTGATLWLPEVHVLCAELARLRGDQVRCEAERREAERLFIEMGATNRARRLLADGPGV